MATEPGKTLAAGVDRLEPELRARYLAELRHLKSRLGVTTPDDFAALKNKIWRWARGQLRQKQFSPSDLKATCYISAVLAEISGRNYGDLGKELNLGDLFTGEGRRLYDAQVGQRDRVRILELVFCRTLAQDASLHPRHMGSDPSAILQSIHKAVCGLAASPSGRADALKAQWQDLIDKEYVRRLSAGNPNSKKALVEFLFTSHSDLVRDHTRSTVYRSLKAPAQRLTRKKLRR